MNYEIVRLDHKKIIGQKIRTINEHGQGLQSIGDAWRQFYETGVAFQIKNRLNDKIIGLYTDYEKDYTAEYTFLCGCEVKKEESSEFEVKNILPGKYAKFSVKGDVMTCVGPVWEYIWQSDLKRTYISDFEEYHNDRDKNGHQTIDIFIGIK